MEAVEGIGPAQESVWQVQAQRSRYGFFGGDLVFGGR